jgi:peptidyl-prolyl cis-trans isomerase D
MRFLLVAAIALASACGPAQPMDGPTMNSRMNPAPPPSEVISTEILARDPKSSRTRVKHILLGWKDLAGAYGDGDMDPRAAGRTKAEAEAAVKSLMTQIAGGADFDTLMTAHSEDPGATVNPDGYWVSPDAQLVLEFRQMGLRLHVGEVGVVQSEYGFHIIKREE